MGRDHAVLARNTELPEQRHGMTTVLLRLDFINQAAAVKIDADSLELI